MQSVYSIVQFNIEKINVQRRHSTEAAIIYEDGISFFFVLYSFILKSLF